MRAVKTIFWGLIFSSVSTASIAADYEVYATIPGGRFSPTFHMLLAMEKCPSKGAPNGWKRGAYRYKHGDEPACWITKDDQVKICPSGQYETTYEGTTVSPCHAWPRDNFYKTK